MADLHNIEIVPEAPESGVCAKELEENLREAKDLSQALFMLMTGVTCGYPHGIGEDDLMAIYQLATEVRDRARAADAQWHEDEVTASCASPRPGSLPA